MHRYKGCALCKAIDTQRVFGKLGLKVSVERALQYWNKIFQDALHGTLKTSQAPQVVSKYVVGDTYMNFSRSVHFYWNTKFSGKAGEWSGGTQVTSDIPAHASLKGQSASGGGRTFDDGCRGVGGNWCIPTTSVGDAATPPPAPTATFFFSSFLA